jgi:glycosyltransferase involved in cell wall biosynthesis
MEPTDTYDPSTARTRRSNVEVVMIVRDEAVNLPHSLASVNGWADRIHVIDSGSTDGSNEICESMGATVVRRPWPGYAKQKNWAIDHLPFESEWILVLDADEVVLPDLREEILAVASGGRGDVAGCWINRYFVFLGKRIRHCGYYPSWNLRLFRRGRARYEDREVHEHMVVEGSTIRLRGHLEHHDRRGLEAYMAKHNRYSTLEAQEIVRLRRMTDAERRSLPRIGGPLAARRWFKERVYPRLPARWAFRFLHMYLLRLGILDGLTGLRFCLFISAYELLIDLKVVEFEREASRPR